MMIQEKRCLPKSANEIFFVHWIKKSHNYGKLLLIWKVQRDLHSIQNQMITRNVISIPFDHFSFEDKELSWKRIDATEWQYRRCTVSFSVLPNLSLISSYICVHCLRTYTIVHNKIHLRASILSQILQNQICQFLPVFAENIQKRTKRKQRSAVFVITNSDIRCKKKQKENMFGFTTKTNRYTHKM